VALTSEVVNEFIASPKAVAASEQMAWRKRNDSVVYSRIGVEAGGATIGEIVMTVSLVVARDWSYKLVRRREEVLRWDLTSPPARHSNPAGRPDRFPGKVSSLEHEHQWVDGLGMNCAVALDLSTEAATDHRQALGAFCDRANITFDATYQPPPPPGEQLQLR